MTTTQKKPTATAPGDKVVRMYPNNGLKQPVRSFASTFSAITVLKQTFVETESE